MACATRKNFNTNDRHSVSPPLTTVMSARSEMTRAGDFANMTSDIIRHFAIEIGGHLTEQGRTGRKP
jgi:hypothetical protein